MMNGTNKEQTVAQQIRDKYVEKEATPLDRLQALDRRVDRPVNILSYLLGSLGALVMGAGMSLIMTDIGSHIGITSVMLPGLIMGIAGMAVAVANYFIHRSLLRRRRRRYAAEILSLSDAVEQA